MGNKNSLGSVLILVLILCLMIGASIQLSFESAILQSKMLANFLQKQQIAKDAETEIIKIEKSLEHNPSSLPTEVSFLQFVPDTLHFAEKQGSDYYRIQVNKIHENASQVDIKTTYSIQRIVPQIKAYKRDNHLSQDKLIILFEQGNQVAHHERVLDYKISDPLVVGKPDYPFEDPSYRQFQKSQQYRQTVIYALSNQNHLVVLDTRGNEIGKVPLSGIDNIGDVKMTSMDILIQNQWHTLLVGVVNTDNPFLFAIDVTYPFALLAKKENVFLWQKALPLKQLTHQVSIARFVAYDWGIILNSNHGMTILNAINGNILQEMILDLPLATHLAIDTQSRGFCDAIYVFSQQRIDKIDLKSHNKGNWRYVKSYDIANEGATCIISRSDTGEGVFIYFQNQGKIYALWDKGSEIQLCFSIENPHHLPFVLKGNILMVDPFKSDKMTYDAFTGKETSKHSYLGRKTWHQS